MKGVRDIGKVGVLAIALSAGVAHADLREAEAAVAVSYAELDLSKPAGAQMLYDRLQRAAAKVCGVNQRSATVFYAASAAQKRSCYQDALSRAVAQVDAPLVQAQHPG